MSYCLKRYLDCQHLVDGLSRRPILETASDYLWRWSYDLLQHLASFFKRHLRDHIDLDMKRRCPESYTHSVRLNAGVRSIEVYSVLVLGPDSLQAGRGLPNLVNLLQLWSGVRLAVQAACQAEAARCMDDRQMDCSSRSTRPSTFGPPTNSWHP